ncbi:MAG: hypothetical protein AOA66_0010 [Candidatus Bathyarchaeota archaeon BA2]|nr:MAG: hypothetical protein AOA66_0010 [Candidatus Bathyarchaeota archaeon BA2]
MRFFYLFRRERMEPKEESVASLALYLFDVSYVQSVLQSLLATNICHEKCFHQEMPVLAMNWLKGKEFEGFSCFF